MEDKNSISKFPFVNGNYKTHAQYTENTMVKGGIKYRDITEPGDSFKETYLAAKEYREEKLRLTKKIK